MLIRKVELMDMLTAREERSFRQMELLKKYSSTLICFTMNIAGPIKNSDLIFKAYNEGKQLLNMQLHYAEIPILYFEEKTEFTGNEAFYLVDADPFVVKSLCCELEEKESLGRLFDMDVLDDKGKKLERETPRRCLICGNRASICSSRRIHSVDELMAHTEKILKGYFNAKYSRHIAGLCCQALLYELAATPKPGLVDRNNNGSHTDMDFYSFLQSAAALSPYFDEITISGIASANVPCERAFSDFNYFGKKAECAMYESTGGVNTHKGAIFSLGIICGALGRLYGRGEACTLNSLLSEAGKLAKASMYLFEMQKGKEDPKTAGELFYKKYAISGIRGEAASGFYCVKAVGLPLLKELIANNYSVDEASGITLLHLIAHVEDTCLLSRAGDIKKYHQIKERLKESLSKAPYMSVEEMMELDRDFIKENLSAGGCADLLAICWLLVFIGL